MKILVLNCGSSSVKFQLINMDDESVCAKGVVEKIGSSDAILQYQAVRKNKMREVREVQNHETAIEIVLSMLLHPQHGVIKDKREIHGIGHRVVHGGEAFSDSVLITENVKSAIRKCIQFAPLHNPHNLSGIEACEALLSGIAQVAVFDTAFHHTIPQKAFIYGLPYALYEKLGIRKYGFHGTSHRYVAMKAAEALKQPIEKLKMITCHLGNGASITAVDGGRSVDTSMGFTPLEGLIMGTRSGSIDPALVPYIMEHEKLTAKQIDTILNKNSGLLGLTETTNDMREIISEARRGNERHKLALDIYCYAIKKYIGSYSATLGGLHAIVFTGGIGENSHYIRALSLENLEAFGVQIDHAKNKANKLDISAGKVKILVVPTNEELAIARDTCRVFESGVHTDETTEQEEIVTKELSLLTEEDKAELILLWAEDPKIKIGDLTYKLNMKIGKNIQIQTVQRELEILGLIKASDNRKAHIVKEKKNGKN